MEETPARISLREGDAMTHPPSAPLALAPADPVPAASAQPALRNRAGGASAPAPVAAPPRHGGVLSAAAWGIALLGGLLLLGQLAGLVRNALALPPALRWPLLAAEGALLLALLGLVLRGALLLRRVPSFAQVAAADRREDRVQAMERMRAGYLAHIGDPDAYAASCGFDPAQDVAGRLRRLSARGAFADAGEWWAAYDAFEAVREARARELVARRALLVGAKTAASPWKSVDMAVVFWHGTAMVQDLARLYRRRVTRAQSFRLVCHWAFNLYVSGELGPLAGKAGETAARELPRLLGSENVPDTYAGLFGAAGKVVGKVGEGAANAFFAKRMGMFCIRAFSPLAPA